MDFKKLYQQAKDKLTDFGKKPVSDVGQILNIVQGYEIEEGKIMSVVQDIYTRLYQEKELGDQNQARQSWVVASGNNFESFIRNVINQTLNQEGILAIKGDKLKNNPKARDIVKFLTLKANRRCTQDTTGVWPDSDIVLLAKDRGGNLKAFALFNCKTSDHSRNDAVLFWALALRDNNIKYCLMTQDLDKRFTKGDDEASNLRKKCEAYLDRVYSTHPRTTECSQIRKLDFTKQNGAETLFSDLRLWKKDVIPDALDSPIDESMLG